MEYNNNIEKANAKIVLAKKVLKKWSITKSKEEKYDEAYELFEEAGNIYRSEDECMLAIDAYISAIECCDVLIKMSGGNKSGPNKNKRQLCTTIARLAKTHRLDQTIKYYKTALDMWGGSDDVNQIGKLWCEYGDIYRDNIFDGDSDDNILFAIEAYKKATSVYIGSDYYHSSATKPFIESINLMMMINKYQEILNDFDSMIKSNSSSGTSLYWLLKDTFINVMICSMIHENFDKTKYRIDEYYDFVGNNALTFRNTKFLEQLMESINTLNETDFKNVITEYDKSNKLNRHTISILTKLKDKYFNENANDSNDSNEIDHNIDDYIL